MDWCDVKYLWTDYHKIAIRSMFFYELVADRQEYCFTKDFIIILFFLF